MGMVVGSLVGGALGQRYGPRNIMLYTSPPSLVCWVLGVFAPNIHIMTGVRLMHGIVNSAAISVNMRHIASTCCPRYRGFISSLVPELASIGAVIVTFLGGRFLAWRTFALIAGVGFNAVIAASMFVLPSDPAWLLGKGRLEEARRSLLFYRGPDADTSEIKAQSAAPVTPPLSTMDLVKTLKHPRFLLPVLYMCLVFSVNVWCGFAVIQNYAVLFFRRVGVTMEPFLLTIVMTVSRLPVILFSSVLVDRCGRRPLLIFSALGMSACHLGMIAFFLIPAVAAWRFVPIVCLIGATCCFQLGVSPITWVLLGELLPAHLGELCAGWLISFYSLMTMAQLQALPALLSALGEPGVFALWSVILLVMVLFTIFLLPETSGLTSYEIETLFHLKAPLQRATLLVTKVVKIPVHLGVTVDNGKEKEFTFVV